MKRDEIGPLETGGHCRDERTTVAEEAGDMTWQEMVTVLACAIGMAFGLAFWWAIAAVARRIF